MSSGLNSFSERRALGWRGLVAAGWRLALISAILSLTVLLILGLADRPRFLFDFRGDLYNAALAILHGHNPYRASYLAHLAALQHRTGAVNPAFAVPVYPAPVLLASVPFGLLPLQLGGALFIGLSIGGVVWGLRLLGVRDWRCIALVLVSWPCVFGLWFGTLSPLLIMGCGLAWRAKDGVWRCATSLSAMVLAKVFPWPLLLWPLLTRRWRTLVLSCALIVLTALGAWAVISWSSLGAYPHMLSNLSYVERNAGVSLTTTLISFGAPSGLAQLLALACAAALVGLAWRLARQPGRAGHAFGLLVMAALTASPLIWVHYEVLLFVPIALLAPRLSPLWFIPVVSGLVPVPRFHSALPMLMWPLLEALVVIHLCRPPASSRQLDRLGSLAADLS